MFAVKRAILLAAGRGERLRPWTDTTPKPLLRVQGQPLLHRLIARLQAAGIREIYVVTGYKAEQFAALPVQFPGVQLLFNPYYAQANNILSLYAARAHLPDCLIMDSDQLLADAFVLPHELPKSCYCCTWQEQETREWLLTVQEGRVVHCRRAGGRKGWQLFSLSFWSAADGARLAGHLAQAFQEPALWHLYWDDLALTQHPQDYDLGVYPVQPGDILEFDSAAELAAIDAAYKV